MHRDVHNYSQIEKTIRNNDTVRFCPFAADLTFHRVCPTFSFPVALSQLLVSIAIALSSALAPYPHPRPLIRLPLSTMDSYTSSSNALMRTPQLNSSNYRQWSFAMKFLLDSDDLWELVQPPNAADSAEIVVETSSTQTLVSDSERKRKKKVATFLPSILPTSYSSMVLYLENCSV